MKGSLHKNIVFFYLLLLCLFPAPIATGQSLPDWFRNPYTALLVDRQTYLTGRGLSNSYDVARSNAIRELAAIFGQDIQAVQILYERFRKTVNNDYIVWTEDTYLRNTARITTNMDNLIGAEIRYYTRDDMGHYFVLAVLNRAIAAQEFTERIRANQEIINMLTTMSANEGNSFIRIQLYEQAAVFTQMNFYYGAMLRVTNRPWPTTIPTTLPRGDIFHQRANEIRRTILIGINVNNDRGRRIQHAFASFFSEQGFRIGGTNSRYVLEVDIDFQTSNEGGQREFSTGVVLTMPNRWYSEIRGSANLIDTATNTISFSYSFFACKGERRYTNQQAAESSAVNRAVSIINVEFINNLASNSLRRN